MKYNDKDQLQDHALAVAGGILNIAMLFSAQFPEGSVQIMDLRNSVRVHDGNDTKVAHTRLRFRFTGWIFMLRNYRKHTIYSLQRTHSVFITGNILCIHLLKVYFRKRKIVRWSGYTARRWH
jgi:hypothetical protein